MPTSPPCGDENEIRVSAVAQAIEFRNEKTCARVVHEELEASAEHVVQHLLPRATRCSALWGYTPV